MTAYWSDVDQGNVERLSSPDIARLAQLHTNSQAKLREPMCSYSRWVGLLGVVFYEVSLLIFELRFSVLPGYSCRQCTELE